MTEALLPENGAPQLGAVRLPAGKRLHAYVNPDGSALATAWVTTRLVPDPGRVWLALSDASEHTGLAPVSDEAPDSSQLQKVLGSLRPARIGRGQPSR